VTSLAIKPPNGSLSINARPWGEVLIDGRSVGLTPIANLAVPIGVHEITWRHPQLGETRRTVAVTAKSPTRVSTEFNK
jgi:PEGA domain-containing protein